MDLIKKKNNLLMDMCKDEWRIQNCDDQQIDILDCESTESNIQEMAN